MVIRWTTAGEEYADPTKPLDALVIHLIESAIAESEISVPDCTSERYAQIEMS